MMNAGCAMNRGIRIIVTLALTVSSIMAEPIYTDVYSSVEKAMFTRKPIVFVVMSTTCPHCLRYWNDSISDLEVTSLLDDEFEFAVSIVDQGGKVPSNLPFNGRLPTTFLLSPDAQLLSGPMEGKIDKGRLYSLLYSLKEASRSR